jgi:hypothetical protein
MAGRGATNRLQKPPRPPDAADLVKTHHRWICQCHDHSEDGDEHHYGQHPESRAWAVHGVMDT